MGEKYVKADPPPIYDEIYEQGVAALNSDGLSKEAACELLCRTGQPDEHPYHHKDCPIAKDLRDCWTTPEWLTELLPRVTLDPCSNPRSSVKATRHVMLEEVSMGLAGLGWEQGDGLAINWKNRSVFCNPPYGNILPWARKADDARAFIFLVNVAPTTKWWRALREAGGAYRFEFDKRLAFVPPPRIRPSSNMRDSCLVCNREGWQMIGTALDGHGRWWADHVGYVAK